MSGSARARGRRVLNGQPALGPRFTAALGWAAELHADQRRKGTQTPYVAHLLGVASLVLEDGGSEEEAVAALLHDAAEDQGGRATLHRIGDRFGERVAGIVEECSDSLVDTTVGERKEDWHMRRSRTLDKLDQISPGACRILLADKAYNARSLVRDLQTAELAEDVFRRFSNPEPRDHVEHYRMFLAKVRELAGSTGEAVGGGLLVEELSSAVEELIALT